MSISGLSGLRAGVAGLPIYIYYKNIKGEVLACSDSYARLLDKSDQFTFLKNHEPSLTELDAFGYDLSQLTEMSLGRAVELTADDGVTKRLQVKSSYIEALNAWCCFAHEINTSSPVHNNLNPNQNPHQNIASEQQPLASGVFGAAEFSRDLKLPLHMILNLATMLMGKVQDKEAQNHVKQIFCYAHRLFASTMNMFALFEQRAGGLPIDREPTDLLKLVEDLTEMSVELSMPKSLSIRSRCAKSVPKTVVLDRYRIESILQNLMSNAVKFTENGFIELSVELSVELSEKLGSEKNNLKFCVRDTGIGMSIEKQQAIFESSQKECAALGLGLIIVKQFVKDLSGTISLKSTEGQGAVFTVVLPLMD